MLAHAILKFLLCLSNVGLIAYLAGCFVYDTHFPAFSIVGTFSINFRRAVAVAGSIHEVARYDYIERLITRVHRSLRIGDECLVSTKRTDGLGCHLPREDEDHTDRSLVLECLRDNYRSICACL
jgi:hypothetical protein